MAIPRFTSLLLFSAVVQITFGCTCLIGNCTTCNADCSNCTLCNSSAPFLNLNAGETEGKSCTLNCTSLDGYHESGGNKCFIDKKCTAANPFARRRSDGGEKEIICIPSCPIGVGYQDTNKNCYDDYKCPPNTPFIVARQDGSDSERICSPTCKKTVGYQDQNNKTACYPEKACPPSLKYIKMKSDDSGDERVCIYDCPSSIGYLDNSLLSNLKCYSDKKCPAIIPFAYMASTKNDPVIPCITTCNRMFGYRDETDATNKKCFYDYQCNQDAPFTYATAAIDNLDFFCWKDCSVFNGTIDESKSNGTWCFTDLPDRKCSAGYTYFRKRSDGTHDSVLCLKSCHKYNGYILNKDCYYDKQCPASAPYARMSQSLPEIRCSPGCSSIEGYVDATIPNSLKCYLKDPPSNASYCYDDGLYIESDLSTSCSKCDITCRNCIGAGKTNCTQCNWDNPYLWVTSSNAAAGRLVGNCSQWCDNENGFKDETDATSLKCYLDKKCQPTQYYYPLMKKCYWNCPAGLGVDEGQKICYKISYGHNLKIEIFLVILPILLFFL